jgi:hypothetical protein
MRTFYYLLIFIFFNHVCDTAVSYNLQLLLDDIWQYKLSINPTQAS